MNDCIEIGDIVKLTNGCMFESPNTDDRGRSLGTSEWYESAVVVDLEPFVLMANTNIGEGGLWNNYLRNRIHVTGKASAAMKKGFLQQYEPHRETFHRLR